MSHTLPNPRLSAGQLRKALAELQWQDRSPAGWGTVQLLLLLGRIDQAAERCRKLHRAYPERGDLAARAGLFDLALGCPAESVAEHLRFAVSRNPLNGWLRYWLGEALRLAGNTDAAMAEFRAGLRCRPDLVELWEGAGLLLAAQERHEEALTHLDAALAGRSGKAPELWKQRGICLYRLGNPEAASGSLQRVTQETPADSEAWGYLGLSLCRIGVKGEAATALTRAVALGLVHAPLLEESGTALLSLGRPREAAAAFRQALTRSPSSVGLMRLLADAQGRVGRPSEALELIDRALAMQPENPELLRGRAHILMHAGRYREALGWLDQAIDLSAETGPLLADKATCLFVLGQMEHALTVFRLASLVDPQERDHFWRLGACFERLGKEGPALECYNRALAPTPNRSSAS